MTIRKSPSIRFRPRRWPVAAFTLALSFPALAQAPGDPAPGMYDPQSCWENPGQVTLAPEELLFTEGRASHFRSETAYFTGLLDNGWIFTISYSTWRYSWFGGTGIIVILAEPDGTGHWFQKEVKKDELKVGKDGLSIRFDGGLIEGKPPGYRIQLQDIQGFSCDLSIRSLLDPWKPGNGFAYLSKEKDVYVHFRVPVPWAEVSGTLQVPGPGGAGSSSTLAVRGECYGDQSTLVAPLRQMSSPVYALRIFSPPETSADRRRFLGLYEAVSHEAFDRKRQSIFLLASRAGWTLTTRNFTITPSAFTKSGETPYEYPTRYRISVQDQGWRLEGEYTLTALYNVNDILRQLPPLLRSIADAFIKRPVIFRGAGEFRGELTEPGGAVRLIDLRGPVEYMIIR